MSGQHTSFQATTAGQALAGTPRLARDDSGQLVWYAADGRSHAGVQLVRAFPLSAPDEHLGIVDAAGHELASLDGLASLDPDSRSLALAVLAEREFMPVVQRILAASRAWLPSVLEVETDRGPTRLAIDSEEAIRRIGTDRLLVRDDRGISFLVPSLEQLDRRSRRLLERFL
jgi:hypothetical protein